jgi:selenide,water dikinase
LSQVVRQLAGFFPATEYPEVLIGLGEPDDAAVIRIDESRALIKTVDFFTPVVDDPWTFGAIAAVNAMSDVYAMGGDVVACLNVAGFPNEFPNDYIVQIFAGGATKVREAKAAITGGHTVVSPEPFYGLSVTGWVDPSRIMRKGGARPGDRLFLTKPLGTGIITTAAKVAGRGETQEHRAERRREGKPDIDVHDLDAAVISMLTLNRTASQVAQEANVRGATDITGFGLLGHAAEMAIASSTETGAALRIRSAEVPALSGVRKYIEAGYLTRGSTLNPSEFGEHVHFAPDVPMPIRTLMWEAETSGGLLLAVPEHELDRFRQTAFKRRLQCWEIGDVVAGEGIEVS